MRARMFRDTRSAHSPSPILFTLLWSLFHASVYATRRPHTAAPAVAHRGLSLLAVLAALWLAAAVPAAGQSANITALYNFSGPDGSSPYTCVIQASDGNLYGTTYYGGANNWGTVFRIATGGAFTSGPDAQFPSGLIQASDGNLYGTTVWGGAYGEGRVFKITPGTGLTTLYSFSALGAGRANTDGISPQAGLIQASDGNLYGTTYGGGANGYGTVFRITTGGTLTTLYNFNPHNGTDGCYPEAVLIQASDGNLYSTTYQGGANNLGTVFRITTGGAFTTLYSFSGTDGRYPYTSLIQASDGNLYSTTYQGGANDAGTVFRITTGGTLTTLYSFSALSSQGTNTDGANPSASLLQAADGNLYGTTYEGGANGEGTVFQITTGGALTTLHSFSAFIYFGGSTSINTDGVKPYAGLIQAADGNLYGTATGGGTPPSGGRNGYGTVFRANGIYPQPGLLSLSSSSQNAGAPTFTLTVNGTGFQPFSTVNWNGMPLSTTFVSASVLKATVPASLLASPGYATLTVVTGAGGGTSNAKSFDIPLTTLTFSAASLINNSDGTYTAQLMLQNTGYKTATNVMLTQSQLGAATTSTSLPLNVGSLAPGAAVAITLTYPASAGMPGSVVTGKASGTFTGGTFSQSTQVVLP